MELNEKAKAMAMLSHFADTGQWGSFQAGQGYGGAMGEYQLDPLEQQGTNSIANMLKGGDREITQLGVKEITDLLKTDKYDPYEKGGVYSGMKRNILREQSAQQDKLAQLNALTGSTRSTGYEKESGLLAERTSGQLSDTLAQLYSQFGARKLAGAETAVAFGSELQRAEMERANEARAAGAVERILKDQQAKAQYSDWLRGRREQQSQIDIAQVLFAKASPSSAVTTPEQNSTNYGEAIGNIMNIVGMFKGSGGAGGATSAAGTGSGAVSSNFSLGNNSLGGSYNSSIASSGSSGGFLS